MQNTIDSTDHLRRQPLSPPSATDLFPPEEIDAPSGTGLSNLYRDRVRPGMGKIMQALNLDKYFHRAEGDLMYYRDEQGREVPIVDFVGGYGALFFGHNHPELKRAAVAALHRNVAFAAQGSVRGATAVLADRLGRALSSRLGRKYVVNFGNSGAEAVEMAMKHAEMARLRRIRNSLEKAEGRLLAGQRGLAPEGYALSNEARSLVRDRLGLTEGIDLSTLIQELQRHNQRTAKTKPTYISLRRGFHGKTTGAGKLTSNPRYRLPFMELGPSVCFIEVGDLDGLSQVLDEARLDLFHLELDNRTQRIEIRKTSQCNVPALFLEPIQGEGGVEVLPAEFVAGCERLCRSRGVPVVFDEIQTGMGRTGALLASEDSGARGDYYLFSKSLGGGLVKISALAIDARVYEEDFSLIHSSTFAEDDLSSAVALRALELIEEKSWLLNNCRARGHQLMDGLRGIQARYPGIIRSVQGRGLMIGVHFERFDHFAREGIRLLSVNDMLGYAMMGYLFHEHRIRVAPLLGEATVLRLEPSALISEAHCDSLLRAFERLCEVLYKMNIYALTRFMVGLERPHGGEEIEDFRAFLPEYKKPAAAKKVAFIGHFIDPKDLPCWDPGYGLFSEAQLEALIRKVYRVNPAHLVDQITVESALGEPVSLQFIGLSISSEIITEHMKARDLDPVVKMVEDGVAIAHRLGCSAVGFGGYTSIVTNNCKKLDSSSAAFTTGNSLTAGMGFEAIIKACGVQGIDLETSCFAALGANGNIASVYAELMAERVPSIILIGREGREAALQEVAHRIYYDALVGLWAGREDTHALSRRMGDIPAVRSLLGVMAPGPELGAQLFTLLNAELGSEAPIQISTSPADLRPANVILGASNAPGALIYPEMLREGPIVICDVALPMDTHDSVLTQRPDVTVLQGGVVQLPRNPDFRVRGIPLPPGRAFACMSETLLLGLADVRSHYSRGGISKVQVKKILEIAKANGFALGELKKQRSY